MIESEATERSMREFHKIQKTDLFYIERIYHQ